MKIAQVKSKKDSEIILAVVSNDSVLDVRETGIADGITNLQDLIALDEAAQSELRKAVAEIDSSKWQKISDYEYLPAVMTPPITLAVGLNYDEHANELNLDNDAGPVLFSLFPNSLSAHEGSLKLRKEISTEVDYEGELGIIIGKAAKDVSVEKALDYVFGYTIINDITARDIQFREPQWSRCKSFDGFTPVGPWVVTADEVGDPQDLRITTDVDDLRVQDATTGYMIRSVASLISSLSEGATLQPGTLIATGSPGGAGKSRKPPLFLTPGKTVTVSIEKLGSLTTYCV